MDLVIAPVLRLLTALLSRQNHIITPPASLSVESEFCKTKEKLPVFTLWCPVFHKIMLSILKKYGVSAYKCIFDI